MLVRSIRFAVRLLRSASQIHYLPTVQTLGLVSNHCRQHWDYQDAQDLIIDLMELTDEQKYSVQRRGRQTLGPFTKSSLLPVFINKVLLEHSHAHLLTYCLCLFSCYNGRAEQSSQTTIWPAKPKIFTLWLFTEESLPNLALVQWFEVIIKIQCIPVKSTGVRQIWVQT